MGGAGSTIPATEEEALASGFTQEQIDAHKAKTTAVPCNFEFEKAVFFRKLDASTSDETIRAALTTFGPLDYCYIARDEAGASKKLGRAKFRAVAIAAEDSPLEKDAAILQARRRAVENADRAVEELDKSSMDGAVIRLEKARPADDKEYSRYGDY